MFCFCKAILCFPLCGFSGAKKKPYLTSEQFVKFLNNEQRDPRLNEILYPYFTQKQSIDLINMYETKPQMAAKGTVHSSHICPPFVCTVRVLGTKYTRYLYLELFYNIFSLTLTSVIDIPEKYFFL